MSKERIQKALARQGLGSRRQIEIWIKQGEIQVNDKVATLGDQVKAGDVVMHGGRKIIIRDATKKLPRVLMYHKPEGEVCSRSDPEGRPTIFDNLPGLKHSRWVAVGRLDLNTSGLILVTDDGELANRLMHPSNQMEREYAVRVLGTVSDEILKQLTQGVQLEDGKARFEEIVDSGGQGANHWYHVVLMEGRNREVRRMWEAVGLKVSRLMRVRYGNVILTKSQRPGKSRELSDKKVIELASLVGLEYELEQAESDASKRSKAAYMQSAGRPKARSRSPRTGRSKNNHANKKSPRKKTG
ncbi:MAG: pseudouridine synthase [Gammaproteobacteria bacterium]|nr:pseudouridine synthase [Gammaproteobacteria bacterium]